MESRPLKADGIRKAHATYVLDRGYVDCTLISAYSLLKHTSERGVDLLFLTCGDMGDFAQELNRLRQIFPHCSLTEINDPKETKSLVAHISTSTLLRLGIPKLLKRRTLYLDGDTLVRDDINKVYNTNLNGKLIGVCRNPGAEIGYAVANTPLTSRIYAQQAMYLHAKDTLKLSKPEMYFNAGVLLLDCSEIQHAGLGEKVANYPHDVSLKYHDQDHLNLIFDSLTHELPAEWNSLWGNSRSGLPILSRSRREFYKKSRKNPAIIHFAGGKKPWKTNFPFWRRNRHFWSNEWHKVAKDWQELRSTAS